MKTPFDSTGKKIVYNLEFFSFCVQTTSMSIEHARIKNQLDFDSRINKSQKRVVGKFLYSVYWDYSQNSL